VGKKGPENSLVPQPRGMGDQVTYDRGIGWHLEKKKQRGKSESPKTSRMKSRRGGRFSLQAHLNGPRRFESGGSAAAIQEERDGEKIEGSVRGGRGSKNEEHRSHAGESCISSRAGDDRLQLKNSKTTQRTVILCPQESRMGDKPGHKREAPKIGGPIYMQRRNRKEKAA